MLWGWVRGQLPFSWHSLGQPAETPKRCVCDVPTRPTTGGYGEQLACVTPAKTRLFDCNHFQETTLHAAMI